MVLVFNLLSQAVYTPVSGSANGGLREKNRYHGSGKFTDVG